MKNRIRVWLGLDDTSDYVKNYIRQSNAVSTFYLSFVALILELLVVIYFFIAFNPNKIDSTNARTLINSFALFLVFILATLGMLIYTENIVRMRAGIDKAFDVVILIYSVIIISIGVFGTVIYSSGGSRIIPFVAILLFVTCLLRFRPIISLVLVTVSFGAVYSFLPDSVSGDKFIIADMFILWGIISAISTILYVRKKRDIKKIENLETTNDHHKRASVTDELTGIANMDFFRSRASVILSDPSEKTVRKVFLYLDIENFKAINEKYGFDVGNEYLVKFANTIVNCFPDALVARIGDDHFVLLDKRNNFRVRLTEVRTEIFGLNTEDTQFGLKAGSYSPTDSNIDPMLAIDYARYACNSVKKRFELDFAEYDEELSKDLEMKQHVLNNIDNALDVGDIKVYYQPVIKASTGHLCGYEALTKWNDPKYGIIRPAQYIPVLEEYRQVHKIDMIVIETVFRDIRRLLDDGLPALQVSINFSKLDFELTDVVEILESCAKKYYVPRNYIHVEVTESALSGDLKQLREELNELTNLGYALWLDDFGSGFSSLNVLKDFNFDLVKIDKGFLSTFRTNPDRTKAVIKNIISMAKDLGMETLCEGIETHEEAEYLKSVGCDRLQGYVFSKPLLLEECLKKIENKTFTVD